MPISSSSSVSIRAIPSRSASSWALVAALILTALAFAVLVSYSWTYYGLAWDARFDAPLHRSLRSSGSIGHLYGNVGLALILGNLLYLVRRRFDATTCAGSSRRARARVNTMLASFDRP